MIGIYKIENLINGKVYIGQSTNMRIRWNRHRNDSKIVDSKLYRAIRKYGLENFIFEIVESCEQERLNELEKFYIEKFNSCINGYNSTFGGDCGGGAFKTLTTATLPLLIKDLQEDIKSYDELCLEYNVTKQTLSAINNGRSWFSDSLSYPLRESHQYRQKHEIKKTKEAFIPCIICGEMKSNNGNVKCVKCSGLANRVCERPAPLELAKMIVEEGFEGVGRKYGIKGNSIKKWCVGYNIPSMKKELVEWYEQQIKLPNNQ